MHYLVWTVIVTFFYMVIMCQLCVFKSEVKRSVGICIIAGISSCGGLATQICFLKDVRIFETIQFGEILKIVYLFVLIFVVGKLIQGGIVRAILNIVITDILF